MPLTPWFTVRIRLLFAALVVASGCTDVLQDRSPSVYESSTRFSVRYDEVDEVLLLSKPPTAQCFWVQRWSSDEHEWLVVGAIPGNGIISPGVGEHFGTKDIENPGCEDEGLEPAPLWTAPFFHATTGIYRVVWLAEGEYSAPIEIL